jgi:hypothetical protein
MAFEWDETVRHRTSQQKCTPAPSGVVLARDFMTDRSVATPVTPLILTVAWQRQ